MFGVACTLTDERAGSSAYVLQGKVGAQQAYELVKAFY
jgi:hypothetical protein